MYARTRLLSGAAVTAAGLVLAAAATPAVTDKVKRITPTGVGGVRLGDTYRQLRAAHLIAGIGGPGCELAGPNARSARLLAPLAGSVDFTQSLPRRVAAITLTGGARAHGVGVGSTRAAVKRAFPTAVFDHSTEPMFEITLVKVPRRTGWRLQFALDVKTGRVTLIGLPTIQFCD